MVKKHNTLLKNKCFCLCDSMGFFAYYKNKIQACIKIMNPFMMLIIILETVVGIGSCLYVIVSLFGTLGYKIFRKIRYGASLYD